MRTFTIIWFGQLVSTIGSAMTAFAFSLWIWQITGSATALALVGFFSQLPRIFIALFAGMIVDRFNRKRLMILGDTSAVICTIVVGVLYATQRLEIWHLYAVVALHGGFGQVQNLAYSSSVALMVPKQHYTRASSMGSLVTNSAAILSPALAGSLYPLIGLSGIIWVDVTTFAAAFSTLLLVQIPQPSQMIEFDAKPEGVVKKVTFGFQYILQRPGLVAMSLAFSSFWFVHQLGEYLLKPMILARTSGDVQILGTVATAAGVGGLIGAVSLSIWGGFKRRVGGMLLGFIGVGLGKTVLGFGQSPVVWIPAQIWASLCVPLLFCSSNAIWYAKVPPVVQGRVFAADEMIGLIIASTTALIVGPLADQVFEPAMQPDGVLAPIFGSFLGTGSGSGIALLYVLTSLCIVFIGVSGYAFQTLRDVEHVLPDHDRANS
jgi:DHA3 family macrolide efflux protein-like MFS transporter